MSNNPTIFPDNLSVITISTPTNNYNFAVVQGSYSMSWERLFSSTLAGNLVRINFLDSGPGYKVWNMQLYLQQFSPGSPLYKAGVTEDAITQMTNLESLYMYITNLGSSTTVDTGIGFIDANGFAPQWGIYFSNLIQTIPEYSTNQEPYIVATVEFIEFVPGEIIILSSGSQAGPLNYVPESSNSFTPSDITAYVQQIFGDVSNQALAVAKCESGLRPEAVNATVPYYKSAYGLFQIYYTHFPSIQSIYPQTAGYSDDQMIAWLQNYQNNTNYAYLLYQANGWEPWTASEGCWYNYVY